MHCFVIPWHAKLTKVWFWLSISWNFDQKLNNCNFVHMLYWSIKLINWWPLQLGRSFSKDLAPTGSSYKSFSVFPSIFEDMVGLTDFGLVADSLVWSWRSVHSLLVVTPVSLSHDVSLFHKARLVLDDLAEKLLLVSPVLFCSPHLIRLDNIYKPYRRIRDAEHYITRYMYFNYLQAHSCLQSKCFLSLQ